MPRYHGTQPGVIVPPSDGLASCPPPRRRSGLGAALTIVVLLVGQIIWLGFGGWLAAPASAADATMTFTGALNAAGLLNALRVQPASVSIPAGGQVTFANAATVPLTVNVAGRSFRLTKGGEQTVSFAGDQAPSSYSASATANNLPLVGSLTSSSGRILVAPIVVAPAAVLPGGAAPGGAPPVGAAPVGGAPGGVPPGGSALGGPALGGPALGGPALGGSALGGATTPGQGGPGAQPSVAPSAGLTPGPSGSAGAPAILAVPGPSGSAGVGSPQRGGHSREGGDDESGTGDGPDGPNGSDGSDPDGGDGRGEPSRAAALTRTDGAVEDEPSELVLPAVPGLRSEHDQRGLLILLAIVLVLGVGSAVVRTVLAYRTVLVGAHSVNARGARRRR